VIRKVIAAIILVPLAVVILGFAVANRQSVSVSFDPFNASAPAYSATLPLFLLIFVLLIVGVIIGGIAAWLRQGRWRSAARRAEAEHRHMQAEIDALRRRLSEVERGGALVEHAPLSLRSPAS
jgi:uncharacterized integral membrane protein